MKKNLRWKVILVLIVIGLAIFLAYPPGEKIHLGLDLEGGMHLVLEVITEDALSIETDQEILRLEEELKKKKLEYKIVAKEGISRFSIQEINPAQEREISDLLDDNFRDWNYSVTGSTVSVSLKPAAVNYLKDLSVKQAQETIQNRVDELGLAEPTIQRQGTGNRIIVELPGVENPDRIKNIIKTTALLEWRLVLGGPAPDQETLLRDLGGEIPPDQEVLKGDPERTEGGYYLVSKVAPVTGQDLINARRSVDEWNNPAVLFTLNAEAGRRFYKFTSDNLNKPLSIILDGKIQEVATIRDRIPDRGVIHGTFTVEQAEDLALILRAGPLPATVKYLEERSIGPSLGKDSIRKGLSSMVIALILVIVFMVFYYRLSGFNAVAALTLNILIIMGILGYLGENAVLTLPGIAGIILTIGMAVDANVLVFERIREELSSGKNVWSSIASGFSRAFRTILDANVTTIIAAIFLFQFGTGPIRGFAVTLIIGITASMFTAVFVSRLIFDLTQSRKKKREKLSI
ncbi:MAG: protein translocase subunit SecD [Candidatus Aminicenantes bacterium]|nr:protein translocase subunit SecD [Candidatus Aminicenantes bacterium]MDH5705798.1 protein translocase subunit SecD [Candidatus Aminicenantes bacterium]